MSDPARSDLDSLISGLDRELDAEFGQRLRSALEAEEKGWLVDALVRLTLRDRHVDTTPHRQLSRRARQVESPARRRQRLDRIRSLELDTKALERIVKLYRSFDRQILESDGYLANPPHKGKEALERRHRSLGGEQLLTQANDLFYALLYCDATQGVALSRQRRDYLTVTLPSAKAPLLERFMLAVTETHASGTWLDPEGVSDDIGARNTILQVEFGDSEDHLICDGLLAVLRMINNLEINEEILYARIEELERSTLID